MPRSPEPPPLQSIESADALYSRVVTRGRRLRRERRAFVLTAGMSLLLLAAAIPVALTNDDPAQLATTGPTTTLRPTTTTTTTTPLDALSDPNASTTTSPTTSAPVAVAGATVTPARTTRTTARRSSATTARPRPPTTRQSGPAPTPAPSPTSTSTTVIPASDPASRCGDEGKQPVLPERSIAFVRGGNIWMIGPAGEPAQLTTTGDASKPAWAPDGTQLVFARPAGLFTITPTPSAAPAKLTGTTGGDTDPAWAPDGGRIAFVRGGDIFTVPAGGGTAKGIHFEDSPLGTPTWSPDSCDLAFTWRTYVLKGRSSDRSGVTQVTNNASEPAWGPTNRVAVSVSAGLTLVNPSGGGATTFTNDGGRVATWKSDGTAVAYRGAGGIVSRTVSPTGAPVVVTDQPGDTDPAW